MVATLAGPVHDHHVWVTDARVVHRGFKIFLNERAPVDELVSYFGF